MVTVFLTILNQMEFHLVQNWKENCHYDHIPFNLKGKGNPVFSVQSKLRSGEKFPVIDGFGRWQVWVHLSRKLSADFGWVIFLIVFFLLSWIIFFIVSETSELGWVIFLTWLGYFSYCIFSLEAAERTLTFYFFRKIHFVWSENIMTRRFTTNCINFSTS